ncbi:TldD protein [Actinomadura pelletieri DSM 43383]|uniref:TldD protein n=1 Tax=Actinomadura pelletieri DSM 43383 TaxID=1120940 RepID=A0A495Q9S2_9ACTN|nr:TldD/PmbA family protein [Actinomadura pelletieri]RKS68235.1 TldD protein [Actinomadura pelletieri DSM 43383]
MPHSDPRSGKYPSSSDDVADYEDVRRALARFTPAKAHTANVFIERRSLVTARFADGKVNDMTVGRQIGSCARWISPSESGYRALDSADPEVIAVLLDGRPADARPRSVTGSGTSGADSTEESLVPITGELDGLLGAIDKAARGHDSRVRQVLIDAEWHRQSVVTVRRESIAAEQRHLRYLTIRVVAEEGDRIVTGFYTPATSDPDELLDADEIGVETARRAVTSLSGRPVPMSRMPVVVGPGRGTVLIHEACCHPLEGDEITRGSVYAGRIGERVATSGVTIVDDPLVRGGAGSYAHDDEGTAASPTVMVDDGMLASYLTDCDTAARLAVASSGNGRRESFRDVPIPRMSNTCVRPGPLSPEEIIADTEYGLYAQHVGGGEVIESTGDFVFRVHSGFLIENGRLTDPIQETTVQGNGVEVLRAIDAVGRDVKLGAAKCGKFNQLVPVGVQGPTLRIESLLVGGTD